LKAKLEAQAQDHAIETARLTQEAEHGREQLRSEREDFSLKALTIAKGGEAFAGKVQELRQKLVLSEAEVDQLTARRREDQQAAARSDMEVSELSGVVGRLEQELSVSNSKAKLAQEENKAIQIRIQEAHSWKEQVETMKEELRQKEGILVEKERMIFRIVGEKKKLADEVTVGNDSGERDRLALQALREEHITSAGVLNQQVQKLNTGNTKLLSELEASQAAMREIEARLERSLKGENQLTTALEKEVTEKENQQRLLQAAQTELEIQSVELASLVGCGELEEELTRVKKAKHYMESEMERRIYDLQAQVKETKEKGLAQIERVKKERDELSDQLAAHYSAAEEERQVQGTSTRETISLLQREKASLEAIVRANTASGSTIQELVEEEMSRINGDPPSPRPRQDLDEDIDSPPSTPRILGSHRRQREPSRQESLVIEALRESINGVDGFSVVEEVRSVHLQALGGKQSSILGPWLAVCDKLGLLQETIQEHKGYWHDEQTGSQKLRSVVDLMSPVKMAIERSLAKDPSARGSSHRNTVCHHNDLNSAELISVLVWGYHKLLHAICTLSVANTVLGSRITGHEGSSVVPAQDEEPEEVEDQGLKEMETQLAEKEAKREAQERENIQLQQENKVLQAKYDAVTQHYQSVLGQLTAHQSIDVEVEALRKACDEAQEQVRTLKREQDCDRDTISSMEQDFQMAEMEKVALTLKCNQSIQSNSWSKEQTVKIETIKNQLKGSQTQLAELTLKEGNLKQELATAKAAQEAAEASVSKEQTRSKALEKELATLQKAFTEAQQLLQGKLAKLQQAFANENKALRQKLADATKASPAAEETDTAVNQSTSSNEAQELEVHYTRLMAAQQFEFSKERDQFHASRGEVKKEKAKLSKERDGLLENMHSLASDVQHLEEQLAKAEQDLRQALYYIQENDKSVHKKDPEGGSAMHQQLKRALQERDVALAAVQHHTETIDAAQAEYEVHVQHLSEELSIYKEAVKSLDEKQPAMQPGEMFFEIAEEKAKPLPQEHVKRAQVHQRMRPAKQVDRILKSTEHHMISAGVA